jgi:hypothetical protein
VDNTSFQIVCLMVSGRPLTGELRGCLYRVAREMMKCGWQKEVYVVSEEPDFQGTVRTDFETRNMGSICGIEFTAEVNAPSGKTNVRYLVREVEPENIVGGFWMQSVPERAAKAHLN